MTLVSVIMPYYKKKKYLKKSILSVLNQTYKNFEIILINDDPSEDKNFLINIKKLDNRIIILHNKTRLGAGFSRNKGIKRAKGNYLAFLDCDDYWHKDKLRKQLNFMIKNSKSFSYTSYKIINANGNIVGERIAKKKLSFKNLISSCDIGLSTVMLKKNLMNTDLFPKLKTKEDYVLWLKLAKKNIEIVGLKKFFTYWRRLDDSLSSHIIQKICDGFKVYKIFMGYNSFKSFILLFVLSINSLRK